MKEMPQSIVALFKKKYVKVTPDTVALAAPYLSDLDPATISHLAGLIERDWDHFKQLSTSSGYPLGTQVFPRRHEQTGWRIWKLIEEARGREAEKAASPTGWKEEIEGRLADYVWNFLADHFLSPYRGIVKSDITDKRLRAWLKLDSLFYRGERLGNLWVPRGPMNARLHSMLKYVVCRVFDELPNLMAQYEKDLERTLPVMRAKLAWADYVVPDPVQPVAYWHPIIQDARGCFFPDGSMTPEFARVPHCMRAYVPTYSDLNGTPVYNLGEFKVGQASRVAQATAWVQELSL